MFRILRLFFTIFGAVNFFFWLAGGYIWVTDQYEVRTIATSVFDLFRTVSSEMLITNQESSQTEIIVTNESNLTPVAKLQSSVSEEVGFHSNLLPISLTVDQQQCLNEKINSERIKAITAGATPTPLEVITATTCIK